MTDFHKLGIKRCAKLKRKKVRKWADVKYRGSNCISRNYWGGGGIMAPQTSQNITQFYQNLFYHLLDRPSTSSSVDTSSSNSSGVIKRQGEGDSSYQSNKKKVKSSANLSDFSAWQSGKIEALCQFMVGKRKKEKMNKRSENV